MLNLKPICTHRFDGAIPLTDIPPDLHYGLRLCIDDSRFTEPAGDNGHCIVVDFEGSATDSTVESVIRAMLTGHIGWREYPRRDEDFDKSSMNPVGYAALLLATRFLKDTLPPNLVLRDNVAIHIPLAPP